MNEIEIKTPEWIKILKEIIEESKTKKPKEPDFRRQK